MKKFSPFLLGAITALLDLQGLKNQTNVADMSEH